MGFSPKTFIFLEDNHIHNSREWFASNKKEYEDYVLSPLIDLVVNLTPTMQKIDNEFICEPKVDRAISRIYRDIRFSKDKSIYRDLMWIVFTREKKLYNGLPGYYLEISPSGFRYGCGFYQASTATMEYMRQLILNNDKEFKKALKAYENQKTFSLTGDLYKKNKFTSQPEKIQNWLNRKSVHLLKESNDMNLLFSNNFASLIAEEFVQIKPIYDFFLKANTRTLTKDNEVI